MSPSLRGGDHRRAETLAAQRVDEPLSPADAAWLDAHLATCDACAAMAADYDADRAILRSLRDAAPQPPRDLWARTAAAIEAESRPRRRPVRGARPARRFLGIPAAVLAPVTGLAVVAIVVGAALFNGSPIGPAVGPGATPIALPGADVAVLSRASDGSFDLSTAQLHEACPLTSSTCAVEPSFDTTKLTALVGSADVEALISPSGDRVVVIQRDATGNGGVFVVPVHTHPAATPTATIAVATATPVVTATPVATAGPTPTATATATVATSASPSTVGSPTPEPSIGASASGGPIAPSAAPSASVAPASEPPSSAPSSTPSAPASAAPTRSVEPSASPDASPTPEPSVVATPTSTPVIAVTPRPDGALEIAHDVVVVAGPASYSRDGSHFAFSARPADGSAGPDVYVWNTKETVARAITDDHRSMFADWAGDDVLVSRVDGGVPTTTRVESSSGKSVGEPSRRAWLPTLSPDGARAAWWDGSVALADDGVTWVPDTGRLVAGAWPDEGADDQALSDGKVGDWEVRWDADGTALATWVAPKAGHDQGKLSLYRVDPATRRADLAKPMLDATPALSAFSLDPGMLAWTGPGKSEGHTLQVLAWKGDRVVRGELPAEGGATLVQ